MPHSHLESLSIAGGYKRLATELCKGISLQVLQLMLVNIMSCAGDPELADLAEPFANGIARHFAFLYAAGTGNKRGPECRPARTFSLKQLDTHVYLDALVEVSHPRSYGESHQVLENAKWQSQ